MVLLMAVIDHRCIVLVILIKGFKIACINVNSLYKHIDEIRFILMSSPLDVLAINESKLDHNITDGEIHIPGYIIIRKDRNIDMAEG